MALKKIMRRSLRVARYRFFCAAPAQKNLYRDRTPVIFLNPNIKPTQSPSSLKATLMYNPFLIRKNYAHHLQQIYPLPLATRVLRNMRLPLKRHVFARLTQYHDRPQRLT